jgi:hypothetical protein
MLRQSELADQSARWKVSALTRVWCAFNMPSVLAIGIAFLGGLGFMIVLIVEQRQFRITWWLVPLILGGIIEIGLILAALRLCVIMTSILRHGVSTRAKVLKIVKRMIMPSSRRTASTDHYSYDYQLAFKDEAGTRHDTEFTASVTEIGGVEEGSIVDIIYDSRDPTEVIVPAAFSCPLVFGEDGVVRPKSPVQPAGFLSIVVVLVAGWAVLWLMALHVIRF